MGARPSLYEELRSQGVSRRGFLKFCGYMSSVLALPAGSAEVIAQALASKPRPSVIWLSVQECTGCSESLLRSFEPTLESLILDSISLVYHHVLQSAAGRSGGGSARSGDRAELVQVIPHRRWLNSRKGCGRAVNDRRQGRPVAGPNARRCSILMGAAPSLEAQMSVF